mgnify:FL=1
MPLSTGGAGGGGGGGGGTPPAGSVTNAMLAAASANSILANPTAGVVSPTNLLITENQIAGRETGDNLQGLNLWYNLYTDSHNLFATMGSLFKFSTGVVDNDPGVGKFKFNSATLGSISKLWIDDTDYKANGFATKLNASTTSDVILYRSTANPNTVFGTLVITSSSIINKTGYREASVSFKAGILPADLELCEIVLLPVGHIVAGFTGTQGDKAGIRSTFITDLDNTNVTAGKIAFNNASLGLVTEIYVNETGQGSIDLTTWYDTMTVKGYIYLSSNTNSDISQAIYQISGDVIDTGAKRTIPVTYLAGTNNFSNNEEIVVNYVPGETGSAIYTQLSDVPSPATNNNMVAIVRNPGNNASFNPVPWSVFSNGTIWRTLNGLAMLGHFNDGVKYIQTATQPSAIASANAGASVSLTVTGHGLTTGTTWAGYNLPVASGTGWTADTGYPIETVTDANTIVVTAAFAGKDTPVLKLANNDIIVHQITSPWLNTQSLVRISAVMTVPAGNTNVKRLKVRYGTQEIYNYNLGLGATVIGTRAQIGLNNNTNNTETQMWSAGSASGVGTTTASPPTKYNIDNSIYQTIEFRMMGAVNEPMTLESWDVQICL